MQTRQQSTWGLRLALFLNLVLSIGWGFLFGVALVRINTHFLPIGMVLVGIPTAVLGNLIVSVAFHQMLPAWHKMVRLLLLVLIIAAGTPLGLAWAVYDQQLDPVQLVNDTGPMIWDAEWLMGLLGLIAGTWAGWTQPFMRRFEVLLHTIFDGPVRLVRFLVSLPGRLLEAMAQFFESLGRGFMWLPLQVARLLAAIAHRVRDGLTWISTPLRLFAARVGQFRIQWPHPSPPANLRPNLRRRRRATMATPRAIRRRNTPASRGNHGDGPRVLSVVEDRCPYCFDVIKRNDPRGVRVCEVCGTPHHADCWSITGKCQVPHLNT